MPSPARYISRKKARDIYEIDNIPNTAGNPILTAITEVQLQNDRKLCKDVRALVPCS